MKQLPKILTIIFFSIFILQMIGLIFLLTTPRESQAATNEPVNVKFIPQVSIPGSQFQKVVCDKKTMTPAEYEKCGNTIDGTTIGKYIQAIYNYAIGIVGILAAVVLMFGGVRWLTAGGSPDKISDAKAWIGASLSGLVLALTSYMILNTINPDLVSFKDITPATIDGFKNGACSKYTEEPRCLETAGCKWENNKCTENSTYAKCGLTKEEKTDAARCCENKSESKHVYALMSVEKYCLDVCGRGWVNVDNSKCAEELKY